MEARGRDGSKREIGNTAERSDVSPVAGRGGEGRGGLRTA